MLHQILQGTEALLSAPFILFLLLLIIASVIVTTITDRHHDRLNRTKQSGYLIDGDPFDWKREGAL